MSSRGRGRRGGRRGLSSSVHRIMRKELRSREFGHKYSPAAIPRQIVQCPWNDFIWTTTCVEEYIYTVGDIAKNVFFTLGMFTSDVENEVVKNLKISLRFKKVEAWEMDGNPILLIVRSLIDNEGQGGREELTAVENLAGRMSFARVGFEWPVSHQSVTFHSDDEKSKQVFSVTFAQEQKGKGRAEVRVHLLWRGTIRAYPQFGVGHVASTSITESFSALSLNDSQDA